MTILFIHHINQQARVMLTMPLQGAVCPPVPRPGAAAGSRQQEREVQHVQGAGGRGQEKGRDDREVEGENPVVGTRKGTSNLIDDAEIISS